MYPSCDIFATAAQIDEDTDAEWETASPETKSRPVGLKQGDQLPWLTHHCSDKQKTNKQKHLEEF
jgi:hypothetical protein